MKSGRAGDKSIVASAACQLGYAVGRNEPIVTAAALDRDNAPMNWPMEGVALPGTPIIGYPVGADAHAAVAIAVTHDRKPAAG